MTQVDAFTEHRPLLFSIAYRMLGSVMDAEDAVQETYLRWEQANAAEIESLKAYLSTIITRLCIDQLRSARIQREQYIGPWLPEPLITEDSTDMEENAALADSLSMAFLVILESLGPVERAAFLLREVFDYEYAEVAGVIGKRQYSYDLWGDVVNIASRYESTSTPSKIHVSDSVRVRLADDFAFEDGGEVDLKGKGVARSWFLVGQKEVAGEVIKFPKQRSRRK